MMLIARRRHTLIQAVAGDLTDRQVMYVLSGGADRFISRLRELRPGLSAGYIEMVAVSENTFDDIWPIANRAEFLYVEGKEIDELRKERTVQKVRNRKKRREGQ
jgi:hypothetical protein